MDIEELLARSAATDAFKADVRSYWAHQNAPSIEVVRHAPRVKVQRLLTQLLHTEGHLPIERVSINALSGCSDFRGTVSVRAQGSTRMYGFVWDCQWRAQEEGWVDCFGFPDQIRAAREFGWQCFAEWVEVVSAAPAAPASPLGFVSNDVALTY
jgi:hypothetical protein